MTEQAKVSDRDAYEADRDAYEAPKLRTLGSVKELTQAIDFDGPTDANFPGPGPHHS